MARKKLPLTIAGAVAIAMSPCIGCEDHQQPAQPGGGSNHDASAEPAVPDWQPGDGTWRVAADDPEFIADLERAIEKAHATIDDAREQWRAAGLGDRPNWLIKWAAPISDLIESNEGEDRESHPFAHVEFVWVEPIEWSPFRIEGVLMSVPEHSIGAVHGELVSFPIEELADWVRKLDGSMNGARQGGYTVDVLEDHFGTPNE